MEENNLNNPTALSGLSLMVQLTATTGQPTLNIEIERSRDGIDWYRDALNTTASTSNPYQATPVNKIQWLFSSNTCPVGGNAGTKTVCARIFKVEPLTRFTRAIFYMSSTTMPNIANDDGAVWGEFIPIKERMN